MEKLLPNPKSRRSFRHRCKIMISRLLSHLEPYNANYEMRLQALEAKIFEKNLPKQSSKWDKIYKEFELSFRGHPLNIEKRLTDRYKNLLQQTLAVSKGQASILLDLGSGHGEFLDLGKQVGYETLGVDLSPEAVAMCENRGHKMSCADLITVLKQQKSSSIDFVAFLHVIEHHDVSFNIEVFYEVKRVLVDGGVFLVETPSLYSLWASSRQFYLDPTHMRPVHPDFIQFLAGSCGFSQGELKEFGKVEHPDACDFKKIIHALNDIPAGQELAKLSKWLYGPMDIGFIFKK